MISIETVFLLSMYWSYIAATHTLLLELSISNMLRYFWQDNSGSSVELAQPEARQDTCTRLE